MSAVTEHLKKRGLDFELIPHEEAYTSIDEAKALGISADEVVKTIVVSTAGGHALIVIPGSSRFDMKLIREAVGDKHARLATEEELERDFAGYELGALPPLGSLLGIRTYIDPAVLAHKTVVFAAGTQKESVRVSTEALFRDEPTTTLPLTKRPKEHGDKEPIR